MYYVYLLWSKLHNELYIGSTNDLRRRFKEHNDGKITSTKRYRPWTLLYYEAYKIESLARMREKRLKYNGNAIRELKKRIGFSSLHQNSTKSGAGFTLIELLVVIMVLSFVGAIVVAILVSTLRGSNKTGVLTEVRQSGNYALSIMAKTIRNSQTISACSDNSITFTSPDSGTTTFACQPAATPATISSNSTSLFPSTVSVSPCSISCTPPPGSGSPISVVVSFTAQSTVDQNVVIPFQTSIQTRNY